MTFQPKNATFSVCRKAMAAKSEVLADKRQVQVTISTDTRDRVGDVVTQAGIDLTGFQQVRTVLWNHDQDHPIASCLSIGLIDGAIVALAQFPDVGISQKADEVYGLIKAGVINAASIGYIPLDVEPINAKKPSAGLNILTSELLEFSFVSVPANPGAIIQERAMPSQKKTIVKFGRKGLYAVSQLAELLSYLGWIQADSEWEAEIEGDGSPIPAMLAEALGQLGAALVAMTAEEVAELLGSDDGDAKAMRGALTKALGGVARGLGADVLIKSGRAFSAAHEKAIREACDSIKSGHGVIVAMMDAQGIEVDDPIDQDADDADPDDAADDIDSAVTASASYRGREIELLRLS